MVPGADAPPSGLAFDIGIQPALGYRVIFGVCEVAFVLGDPLGGLPIGVNELDDNLLPWLESVQSEESIPSGIRFLGINLE